MTSAHLLHGCVVAATLTLGGLVFRTNPHRATNQVYLVLSLFSGLWVTIIALAFLSTDSATATTWIRGSHAIGVCIPLICDWLRLAIVHPGKTFRQIVQMNPFLLFATLPFIFLAQTHWIIQGAILPARGAHPFLIPEAILGPLYFLFAAFFVVIGVLAYQFQKSTRQATGMQRAELNFTCLGILVSSGLALCVSVLNPMITGSSQSTQLASLSVMILNLIIAYGIATRRIMNMAYLFRLFTTYGLLALYLAVLYAVIWWSVSLLLLASGHPSHMLAGLLASLGVAFSLAPANGVMQRFGNQLFAHTAPFNMESVAQISSRLLYSISTTENLLKEFSETIAHTLGTDKVCVLLLEKESFVQVYPVPQGMPAFGIGRNTELPSALTAGRDVIVPSMLLRLNPAPPLVAACKVIEENGYSVAAGLHSKRDLEGLFLLGPKLTGHIYGGPEQHAIQLLCSHLAGALSNAKLYTQLQDSKIYNDILVDDLISGVIAATLDGHISVFNREAQRITRLAPATVTNHPLSSLPPLLAQLLDATLHREAGIRDQEYLLPQDDTTTTPIRISSSVIYGYTGAPLGAFLVINDLTLIRQLELQVRHTDRLASIGTLAAGMAHEIKNPLVSIKAFTQLLPERYDDPDFRDTFSSLVGGEVKRIDSIVNQLLRFSRPALPVLSPTSSHDIIKNALQLIREPLRSNNISLSTSFNAVEDQINADRDQLSQALINFFLNAIDAIGQQGALTIRTANIGGEPADGSPRDSAPNRGMIQIEIQDTGKGIAPNDLSRIFDPFFTTRSLGTGLGLSVAHGIINDHSGTIGVNSEVGVGTTFTLCFPLLKEDLHP